MTNTGFPSTDKVRPRPQSGVTLIELLVVMAVGLILTVMAVPLVTSTMDDFRLRGAMVSAANLAQRCRTVAIQQDASQRLHFVTVRNMVTLFLEPAANGAVAQPAATDPQTWMSPQFSIPGLPAGAGAPPPLTGAIMWGSAINPNNVNQDMYFNSRGLPCTPDPITNVCNISAGSVYYFRYQGNGNVRWVAISISPAGRIETWFWNNANWGN